MIETSGVSKTYHNGFTAVRELNLHVNEGDIFGFLGPNGAGKTTTIRMLDGLLAPTTGTIRIAGMDVTAQSTEVKKIIGVVPESHGYYYWMTAREYLQYFDALFHPEKSDSKYIDLLLERVGLADKHNVSVGQFSRGMKQRLGIAKALINHPKIIFLDEPTLGLDPKGQKEIQDLLRGLNENEGLTIFITSHMLKDIEVLCNRVCIIKDGLMIEQGSIRELQDRYMDTYTILLQSSDNLRAVKLLKDAEHLPQVSLCEERIEITCPSHLNAEGILAVKHRVATALFSEGLDILELSHKSLSMEDVFFKAIERGEKKAVSA
ncbi:MAG: ABC transporter ATP-binding protein [Oscillospiraceae bacterium]|nr:ABC transporter ATP-binding protein [Oscillospiraceae bacterium]